MVRDPKNRSFVFGTPIEGSYYDVAHVQNHLEMYGLIAMQKKRQTLLSKFRGKF